MSFRPRRAVLAVATAASFFLAAVPAQADPDPDLSAWPGLALTYTTTAQYAYEPFAEAGGYLPTDDCVASAEGGAGYHYVNAQYVGSLDPATPAALLYAGPGTGSARRLVAVEWIVKDTGQATPTLFGQTFQRDQRPGYFTLHAWIYQPNPEGLFAPMNPDVTCPTA
ncbi:hypothetical protein [Streptomyces gilvus]|uniref:hypothetical protein n=1 Tax=Streptomyces gilvus TaxID=2920937 RepID=UPI001F0D654C|nr:hypothetical protein [Streptomyces sp. CME 23]MCH5676070.1 hypothetical protein [Streptomyces sp. CME 23]